jgi:PAS domain-containing protein
VADEASVGGPTGNGATEATAFSPALGPALALVDSRGVVVRLTDTFRAGFAPEGSPHLSIWDFLPDPDQRSRLGRVLEGRLLRADLALPSPTGSVNAEAEAVLDAAVMRHALLTVAAAQPEPDPRSGADVLLDDGSVIDSPVIVWITDLSGRYLRINRRYAQRLGIKDADILGKTDAELSPAHVVAEPRSVRHGDRGEPAQLEYTVDAVGRREALTVLRFPLHGLNGAAVAVCGVASSVADAATARSEAERLLRLERWAGLSAAAIRAELIQEWELAELAESDEPSEAPAPVSRTRPAEPAAATAELERMRADLAAARESEAELQARLAEHAAAQAALEAQLEAQTAGRAELEIQLASQSAKRAELQTQLASESAARAELETQLVEETARSAELRAAAAVAARRADEIVSNVATEHSRIAELQAALDAQRRRAEAAEREVGSARGRTDVADREIVEARGRAEAAEREVAAELARAEAAEREAGEARARIGATDRDLAAARARIEDLERAGAQSSEATEQVNAERAERTELEQRVTEAQRRADELERSLAAERANAARLREELTARAEQAETAAAEARAAGQRAVAEEIERARATSSAAVDQANAERAARAQLEQQALEAQRRVHEAEQILAAERAEAAWARGELVGRAERAEMAVAEARAAGERAAALVQRAEAAAELARGRAEGLETTLASAREGESENRMALERGRAEIANLHAALEQAQAENETVRETAREAAERLERERRELAARDAAAAAADAAPVPPPPAPVVGPPETGTGASVPGPSWSPDAQRALTSSLARAAEWRTGLKDAIRVLGTEAGWDVVIAWCPDERGRALRCVAMWMSAPAGLSLFETATWQRRQSPTASLAGRTAVGDRASWFGDLSAVSDAQLAAAASEGMEGALLVPMRQGEESIGVLELLTRRPAAPAPEVATAMEAVALQLAHFEYLLRRGAEPRWRLGRL